MTLVDTSVWVDHFRNGNAELQKLLQQDEVLVHPFVTGELACGNLRNRAQVLSLLQQLPQARISTDPEVLHFLELRKLWGRGIGWVDVHLLASAMLSHAKLWTLDKRLHGLASEIRHRR